MTTPSAVLMIGIPASGKSTFCRRYLFNSHVRINLDMLKSQYRQQLLLDACILGKTSFVVDNTNATADTREKFIQKAREAGFRVTGYYFSSRLSDSLERNRLRHGSARIPDNGVRGIAGRLELPSLEEGFDELWYVRMNEGGGFVVERWRDV